MFFFFFGLIIGIAFGLLYQRHAINQEISIRDKWERFALKLVKDIYKGKNV